MWVPSRARSATGAGVRAQLYALIQTITRTHGDGRHIFNGFIKFWMINIENLIHKVGNRKNKSFTSQSNQYSLKSQLILTSQNEAEFVEPEKLSCPILVVSILFLPMCTFA